MSETSDLFQPVKTPEETQLLLEDALKSAANLTLWTKDQKITLRTRLSVISPEEEIITVLCPEDQDPKRVSAILNTSGPLSYFTIGLDRASIFFNTNFAHFENDSLYFNYPEKVFKVQRRKDMRFPLPENMSSSVQYRNPLIPHQILKHPVVDISAGGLSLAIPLTDVGVFKAGGKLEQLTFVVNSRKILCSAIIRHVGDQKKGARYPGKKIGIEFQGIRPADADAIHSFVFEESRKYFTKLF